MREKLSYPPKGDNPFEVGDMVIVVNTNKSSEAKRPCILPLGQKFIVKDIHRQHITIDFTGINGSGRWWWNRFALVRNEEYQFDPLKNAISQAIKELT